MEKKKKKKKKKPKVNLILSHINHTFFILDPQIGPQAFRHTHCTLRNKKDLIQGSICFKLVPQLSIPGPLSKVALSLDHLPSSFMFSVFQAQTGKFRNVCNT